MDTTKTLQELQNELEKLIPAVEVVDKATGFAILANQKFDAIDKLATQSLEEVKEDLEATTKQIRKEHIEFVTKAEKSLLETLKNLKTVVETEIVEYRHLVEAASALIKKIDDINFPERLDKIDNNISAINLGIQNLQNRLGDLSRDVNDGFKESHKKMDGLAEKMSNEFTEVKGRAEFYGAQQSQHAFWIKMMIGINLSLGLGMLLAILTR